MKELLIKVGKYSYKERITRLIEIGVKGNNATPLEFLELTIIQGIRETNGEIDAVRRSRENEPLIEF